LNQVLQYRNMSEEEDWLPLAAPAPSPARAARCWPRLLLRAAQVADLIYGGRAFEN
jgi:hypothetical protein